MVNILAPARERFYSTLIHKLCWHFYINLCCVYGKRITVRAYSQAILKHFFNWFLKNLFGYHWFRRIVDLKHWHKILPITMVAAHLGRGYFISHLLTHWDRVTHICVGDLKIIGSDNGLLPGRRQAIIWNNAGILLIGPIGTTFS